MNDFERFSALVERALVNGWRNAVKAEGTDGILIGHEDLGGEWEFTFSIRVDRSWHPFTEVHQVRSCSSMCARR